MTKENWIKWLQVRIPILKDKANEFWLAQALDGFHKDEQSRQADVIGRSELLKCEHDWHTFFNKGYRKCNKCGEEYTIKAF